MAPVIEVLFTLAIAIIIFSPLLYLYKLTVFTLKRRRALEENLPPPKLPRVYRDIVYVVYGLVGLFAVLPLTIMLVVAFYRGPTHR